MSDLAINSDRLLDLADLACEERASDNEFTELDTFLLGDPASRRRYFNYCRVHVALRLQLRARRATEKMHQQINIDLGVLASEDSGNTGGVVAPSAAPFGFLSTAYHGTIGFFSQELPFSLLIAAVLTSLGLWFASMVYVSSPEKIAKDSSSLPARTTFDPTLKVVGKITGMVDCKWADPDTETFNGANVLLGRKYALASGLMEITYDSGAKVILQGPVTYDVEANGGYLAVGKLTGKLEKKVAGGQQLVASGQWSVASEADVKSQNPEISKSQISNPSSPAPRPPPPAPNPPPLRLPCERRPPRSPIWARNSVLTSTRKASPKRRSSWER